MRSCFIPLRMHAPLYLAIVPRKGIATQIAILVEYKTFFNKILSVAKNCQEKLSKEVQRAHPFNSILRGKGGSVTLRFLFTSQHYSWINANRRIDFVTNGEYCSYTQDYNRKYNCKRGDMLKVFPNTI
jgi:hypothetical protein